MAAYACLTHDFRVFFLVEVAFFEIVDALFGFFWSQTVLIAQVLNDLACFVGRECDAVEAYHSFEGLLPTFRGGSKFRDPAEVPFFVFGVASRAFRYD
jgi:hypothetical protein